MHQRGHDAALVLRELQNATRLRNHERFRLFQAPVWLAKVQGLPEPPLNYSEMLLRCGYHDAASLTALLQAWRNLLQLLDPQVVVLEHAPTAALAARSLGIPAVAVGGTFNLPPVETPLPGMRSWLTVPQERLASSDRLVLDAINHALANVGAEPLGSMSAMFGEADCLLCAYPELDHYAARRGGQYFGPLFMAQSGEAMAWPESEGKRIFVYLSPSARGFRELLEVLCAMPHSVILYAPGISADQIKRYSGGNVRLTAHPCQLDTLAETCDLAITAGNNGTVNSLLLHGVPQLMFAEHLEHYLFGLRVKELGAGEVVDPERPLPPLAQLINQLLGRASYRQAAQQFAARHAQPAAAERIQLIADRIENAMQKGSHG